MDRKERIEKVEAALNGWLRDTTNNDFAAALVDALAPDGQAIHVPSRCQCESCVRLRAIAAKPARRFAVGDTVASRDGFVLGRVFDFPKPGKVGLDDGDIYYEDELRKVEPEPQRTPEPHRDTFVAMVDGVEAEVGDDVTVRGKVSRP